jgi:hypothetical protein
VSPEDQPGLEELMGTDFVATAPEMGELRDEQTLVRQWRMEQLIQLGLPPRAARQFADTVDWHDIKRLVERGCPLPLALRIIL